MVEMADGTVAFDVVATGVKNTWTLKWEAINDTDKGHSSDGLRGAGHIVGRYDHADGRQRHGDQDQPGAAV